MLEFRSGSEIVFIGGSVNVMGELFLARCLHDIVFTLLASPDALVDLARVDRFSRLLVRFVICGVVRRAVLSFEKSLYVEDALVNFGEILDNIFVMFFDLHSFADVFAN